MSPLLIIGLLWVGSLGWLAGLAAGAVSASLPSRLRLPAWTGWMLIGCLLWAESLLAPAKGSPLLSAAALGLQIGTFWGWWHARGVFRRRAAAARTVAAEPRSAVPHLRAS
jgi:hypothetical protein